MASPLQISLHDVVKFRVVSQVAHLWEAKCAWYLSEKLPNFVNGLEGAVIDCGVTTGGEDWSEYPLQNRIAKIKAHQSVTDVLLFDFKTISSQYTSSRGARYHFLIQATGAQRQVAAFIVQNPASPNLVALLFWDYLEARYLRPKKKTLTNIDAKKIDFGSRDIPFLGTYLESYPPEWSPFVMPLDELPEAIRRVEAIFHKETNQW